MARAGFLSCLVGLFLVCTVLGFTWVLRLLRVPLSAHRPRRAPAGPSPAGPAHYSRGSAPFSPTSTGQKSASEGGARHAGPAAPRLGLAPAAPAARPAAAPVRRKRRRRRRRPLGELGAPAALAGPMADLSPAPALREGGPRAHRPSAPSPPPRSRSTSEPEEAELSLSLARTKTRSYGSTASVRAPLGAGVIERHVEHRVRAGDTLQGIALKYGVTVSRARRRGPGLRPPGRGRGWERRVGSRPYVPASPRRCAASLRPLLRLQWASELLLRRGAVSRASA